jgi:Sec-independent protein translocase protein TatA
MLGVGTPELLLILVIAVLVVGPEKMVEYAGKAGRMIAKFRAMTSDVTSEFKDAFSLEADEEEGKATDAAQASPAPQLEAPASAPLSVESSSSPATVDGGYLAPPTEAVAASVSAEIGLAGWVDGEMEVSPVPPAPPPEGAIMGLGLYAEPVILTVAELVPEDDVNAQPIVLEQALAVVAEGVSETEPSKIESLIP